MASQKLSSLIEVITAENVNSDIVREVLEIQKSCVLETSKPASSGFLITIWTAKELNELLNQSSTLTLCRIQKTKKIVAYLLTSPLPLLEESYVRVSGATSDLRTEDLSDSKSVYVYQIAVRSEFRRAHFGHSLVENLIANSAGSKIFTDLMEKPFFNTASHAFFSSFGFRDCGFIEHSDYRGFGSCRWLVLNLKVQE